MTDTRTAADIARELAGRPTALVVTVDGTVTLEPFTPGEGSLAFLQAKVEGMVDVVSLSDYVDMWVNDDGIFTHDSNPVATAIARGFGMTGQPYFGPVVFTGGVDEDGDTLPLNPGAATVLRAFAEDITKRLTETGR